MTVDETLNELLVRLFRDLMQIEGKCLITGEFTDITYNDMHIIEAIGIGDSKKSSEVAAFMSITMGTLTKAIDSLAAKGYVERKRGTKDKRVVRLILTDKGRRAYEHHQGFHQRMIEYIKDGVSEEEMTVVINVLANVVDYFKSIYNSDSEENKENSDKK